MLPYHDVTKHSFTDLAHNFANVVKILSQTVTNQSSSSGKCAFGQRQRAVEARLGRFPYLARKVPDGPRKGKAARPEWMATKARFLRIEEAFKVLKAPKEWPATATSLFSKCNKLKTSEHLLFCGPVGAYYFSTLDALF
jgi:hypothetical protein